MEERLTEFCQDNTLVINKYTPHKQKLSIFKNIIRGHENKKFENHLSNVDL